VTVPEEMSGADGALKRKKDTDVRMTILPDKMTLRMAVEIFRNGRKGVV
jgi:hypothetical protein